MNYSASNTQLWNFVIQLGILAAILLISNVMRRKVAFIQKSLAPTAVIGGFIALILRAAGILHLDGVLLEIITYHTIAI
ncbi:MAG: hypothetical protein PHP79_03170, partial [Clostridia bacterium]|nr:hypothetical protein [Clostridia bacterium]